MKRRHAEVVYLYLSGWSWVQIGTRVQISENTAKNYMQVVHSLLGVSYAFEISVIGCERLCGHLRRNGRLPALDPWLAALADPGEDPGGEPQRSETSV